MIFSIKSDFLKNISKADFISPDLFKFFLLSSINLLIKKWSSSKIVEFCILSLNCSELIESENVLLLLFLENNDKYFLLSEFSNIFLIRGYTSIFSFISSSFFEVISIIFSYFLIVY